MIINFTYDPSVSGAPSGFQAVVESVGAFFAANLVDPITINIAVGWNEVHGIALDPGTIGAADPTLAQYSYSQIRDAIVADATSSDDLFARASLPAVAPVTGEFWIATAEAKALGLDSSTTGVDGYIGVSSEFSYDLNHDDGVGATQLDLWGVLAHEISHVMGRIMALGDPVQIEPSYFPMDLFHYQSNGVRTFQGTVPGYFSQDGGQRSLGNFNTDPGLTFSDWEYNSNVTDAFRAALALGEVLFVSTWSDLRVMDVLGYNLPNPPFPDLLIQGPFIGLIPNLSGTQITVITSNMGQGTSMPSRTGIFFSANPIVTENDLLLGFVNIPKMEFTNSNTFSISADLLPTNIYAGTYYVRGIANFDQSILEASGYPGSTVNLPIRLGDGADNSLDNAGVNYILGRGGNDTITALTSLGGRVDYVDAGSGDDAIFCSGSLWPSNGSIDGGLGFDTVTVTGSFFTNNLALLNVERVIFQSSGSVRELDTCVGAGQTLVVDASAIDPFDGGLSFEGAAETDGRFSMTGSAASDFLGGGALADSLVGGSGNDSLMSRGGNDTLDGGDGNDTLRSGDGADQITGGSGGDTIDCGRGADVVTGGLGNDTIEGGADADVAIFSGLYSAYAISRAGSVFTVAGPDGTDTLSNVERAQFSDRTITICALPISDFNASSTGDILWQTDAGRAAIWLMNGNQVTYGDLVGPNPGPTWHIKGAGDFNGDGKSDILWQTNTGIAAIWEMNGTQLLYGDIAGPNPGIAWHIVGTGDFNADGKADILWETDSHRAAIWEMNGTQVLYGDLVGPTQSSAWHIKGTGDFNGDGRSDILWQNAAGAASIWELDGTQLLYGDIAGPNPGIAWYIVGTGDFNGDGKSDILWQTNAGQAAIWLMNGTQVLYGDIVGPNPGPTWHVKGAADFNGDGKSDILWQTDTGQAAIWLMNGTQLLFGDIVGPNPGTSWHVIAPTG